MYMFSPHADLHLKAAELAIEHTEYFFIEIRKKIGDKEFSNFLRLEVCDENHKRKKSSANRIFNSYLPPIIVSLLAIVLKGYLVIFNF